jgi:hypothetical protein
MKNFKIILLLISISTFLSAQVSMGNTNPNSSAVLDLTNGNQKGFLLDNIKLIETALPSPMSGHIAGMLIYNSATVANVTPGVYYNDGSLWLKIESDTENLKVGDIKQGLIDTDHSGWYIMNGRNVSTLPEKARLNAIALGFATSLPNMANMFFKGINSSENFGQTGGSESFTLTRENLPNVTYTGTTASAGGHNHTYIDRGATMWHNRSGSGINSHTDINGETRTTGSAGNHSHTVTIPTGGSGTPINLKPSFWSVQSFIYLGN